jgi:hypothetical protein
LLRAHSIRVDAMVTGSDRYPPKPDPSGLVAVARLLGVDTTECVYVGDSVGDFGAAAAAGMTSVGVSWDRRTPDSWRHGWPDAAVDRPSRLLRFLAGEAGLGPLAEAVAAGQGVAWHWGSVMRLGSAVFGLGRYFPMSDRRYPAHALSHLIIDSKDEPGATTRLAGVFAELGRHEMANPPQIITSVPPAPDDERDRFDEARAALADAWGARDGDGLLVMSAEVEDYKRIPRDARAAYNRERFEITEELAGERVLLIDDVLTSGGQSDACRDALRQAGAGGVSTMVASVTQDTLPDRCPLCGEQDGGTIRTKRRQRDGHEFLGCSRWPACWWSSNLPAR